MLNLTLLSRYLPSTGYLIKTGLQVEINRNRKTEKNPDRGHIFLSVFTGGSDFMGKKKKDRKMKRGF